MDCAKVVNSVSTVATGDVDNADGVVDAVSPTCGCRLMLDKGEANKTMTKSITSL